MLDSGWIQVGFANLSNVILPTFNQCHITMFKQCQNQRNEDEKIVWHFIIYHHKYGIYVSDTVLYLCIEKVLSDLCVTSPVEHLFHNISSILFVFTQIYQSLQNPCCGMNSCDGTMVKVTPTTCYHETIRDVPVSVLHKIVQVMTTNMHETAVRDTRADLYITVKRFDKVLVVFNRINCPNVLVRMVQLSYCTRALDQEAYVN